MKKTAVQIINGLLEHIGRFEKPCECETYDCPVCNAQKYIRDDWKATFPDSDFVPFSWQNGIEL